MPPWPGTLMSPLTGRLRRDEGPPRSARAVAGGPLRVVLSEKGFAMRIARALFVVLLLLPAPVVRGQAPPADLRDQYNTRSLEAAQHVAKAVQLSQGKKHKEALAAAKAAVAADPKCQSAYFWQALILTDLGEIPDAIAVYKTCLSDDVNRSPRTSATAAVNLAITLAKLKRHDEAHVWFTRGILEDSANRF